MVFSLLPAPAPLPSSRHTFLSTESWCGYVKTPWRIIELTFRVLALLLLWRRANARNVSSNVSRYREPRFLASPQAPQSVGNLKIKIKEILDLSCSLCVFIRCVFVGVSYQQCTSDWINSDKLLPCVNISTRSSVDCSVSLTSLRFSDWVETSNMKPFAISEYHLTLSEVSMREQGQRRLQARNWEKRRQPLAKDWLVPY